MPLYEDSSSTDCDTSTAAMEDDQGVILWSNESYTPYATQFFTSARLMESERQKKLSSIREARDRISRINEEIADLLYSRLLMLDDVENKTSEISNAQYFIGCKADKLREEWKEHKFESDDVKRSVGAIRGLFFQDEKIEAFRKFSCVNIVAPDFWNSSEGCIEFEFSNGGDAFSITIPDITPNKYGIGSHDKEAFSEKLWIGRVMVQVFIDKNMKELAISSLDFDEIRNYLKKLVEDFHAEKRNLYDKFMSELRRHVGASGISNLSWNTASEDDYERAKREYGHVPLDVLLRRFGLMPSGVV